MPELIAIRDTDQPPRAILAGLRTTQSERAFDRAMAELAELARACRIEPVLTVTQNASAPVQATYIGSGKAEEIRLAMEELDADLIIFDQTLAPMQFRNLNKLFRKQVMDRTGLILQIFSEQARTREARLQVEHANLQYIMPRLAGMWTHFGRQAGASGSKSNRGVGETQLELDRRHIEKRMAELEKELASISRERATQREKRLASALPRVALVGYTNAGKSTLMNRLLDLGDSDSSKKVLEQDKLFATLDTTVRKIAPENGRPFLLSDTVGFINELPHSLVKAFRSTLEEVCYADLLLQVVDYSDPDYRECMRVTEETLKEIGAGGIPMICVYNKADRIPDLPFDVPAVRERAVYMSAVNGTGIRELAELIGQELREHLTDCTLLIPYSRGDLLNRIRESGEILSEEYRGDGVLINASLSKADADRLRSFAVPGTDGRAE